MAIKQSVKRLRLTQGEAANPPEPPVGTILQCPICGRNFKKRILGQKTDSAVCRLALWQLNWIEKLLRDAFLNAYYQIKYKIIAEAKKKRRNS